MAAPFVGFLRGRVGAALGLRVEILAGMPGGMLTVEGAFWAGVNYLMESILDQWLSCFERF